MARLVRFLDAGSKGVWANIRMDNNDPCWIGVADTGVLVKKSRVGMFGTKLYERSMEESVKTSVWLNCQYADDLTPEGITHPLLKSFVNAALHCSSIEDVRRTLNEDLNITSAPSYI